MSISEFIGEHKYSKVEVEYPDPRQFPLYYKARKHVFEIGPGETLFIPAGWFHFVFSTDTTDGLNFAVNHWYTPLYNWDRGQKSHLLPHVSKHNLNIEPYDVMDGDDEVLAVRSTLDGLFPSDRLSHLFKGYVRHETMKLKEFLETKNPRYYVAQNSFSSDKVPTPRYPTPLYMKSIWINFGNVRTLCHYDEHDNFLCQIKGRKRVIMFPHEDRDLLYMINPIRMGILKDIIKNNLVFGTLVQVTDQEHTDINDVYSNAIKNYKASVMNIPDFKHQTEFKTVDTKGKVYFHETIDTEYPLRMIWVISGYGEFTTFQINKHVKPGSVIVLPTGVPFMWNIRGNLKFIT